MLQSKKGNMIISLILAIALWMYVVGEMNPTTTKVYRDIPVTLTNSQTLADNGLAVVSTSDENMTVTLSGKRSSLSKIKSTDIIATVDLSDAAEGDNQLKINLSVPDSSDISNQSLNKVTVTVEKRVSALRKVKVNYTGDYANDEEPTMIKSDPASVTIGGARSLVSKVDHIKATVKSDNLTTDESSTSSELIPVDKNGNEVKNITLSSSTAKITSVLYKTKTVSLKVPITDTSNDEYSRTTTAPETIKIKGSQSALDKASSVTAKSIDISDITSSTSIDITPVLDNGIEVSDDVKDLVLKVKVKSDTKTKEFSFSGGSVDLKNLSKDGNGTVKTDSITVSVTGSASNINSITKSDISLSADCDGLDSGTHSVKLSISCDGKYSKITASPSSISVKIE